MGLVTLDVRQESTRHSDAIDTVTQYLGLGSYKSWDEEQRLNFLIGELTGKRPLMPPGMWCAAVCWPKHWLLHRCAGLPKLTVRRFANVDGGR